MLPSQTFLRLFQVERRSVRLAARARVCFLGLAACGIAAWPAVAQAQTPLSPMSLTVSPSSVIGGASVTGTVQLNRAVSPNDEFGQNVPLISSDPAVVSVPKFVTVPPGKDSASFSIATARVLTTQTVTITATLNRVSRSAKLVVQPAVQPTPRLSIKPDRLAFGAAAVGASGGRQRITLTNIGNAPLSVGRFGIAGANPGDFFLRATNIDGAIPPNGSAWVEMEFIPQAAGSRNASLAFVSNAANSPHSVPLSGTGLGPVLAVRPSALSFGGQAVGTRSASQFVTLFNLGNAPLTIQGIGINGDQGRDFLLLSPNGPGTVPVGGVRTVEVAFLPTVQGPRVARLVIVDNAAGSPQALSLSGTGLPPAAPQINLAPSSLVFGSQSVGTRSTARAVVVTNVGGAPLVIRSVGLAGSNPADFAVVSGTDPVVLPVRGQQVIGVAFAPTALGGRSAFLVIQTNAAGSPHILSLSGTGAPETLPPAHFQPALPVGNTIATEGRLGIFNVDPLDQDQNVSAIRRISDDGALYVLDYAGTALLRIPRGPQTASVAGVVSQSSGATSPPAGVLQAGGGEPEILLDTTRQDPVDKVGFARLLRVETGRNGTCVMLALRADQTRGIYRIEKGVLTRLGLLPEPTGPAELAIGDAGQMAYVAPSSAGPLALFEAAGDVRIELVRQGQALTNGQIITGFSELSSNGAGELVARLGLSRGGQAILRLTRRRGLEILALAGPGGNPVARDLFESRNGARPGVLTSLQRPRIGPDGTTVFLGAGDGFVNFYVDGPARLLQPMLIGGNWGSESATFDYEIAADGAVVVRAAAGGSNPSALYLSLPSSGLIEVVKAGDRLEPVGRPVFGPEGSESRFFFVARVSDRPRDRQGRVPVGLFRSSLLNGRLTVEGVAVPGDPIPGKPGASLLSVTQRPAVSVDAVMFGILFGVSGRSPVPTASLFGVPVAGKLAEGRPVADEGAVVPNAGRLAMLRDLAYQADGTLVLNGLLPGAGPVLAAIDPSGVQPLGAAAGSGSGAAVAARPARVQAIGVAPLLAVGQPMAPPDRRLLAVLGRLIPVGTDRQLVVARFSRPDGLNGEGLFTVDRNRLVQSMAATGDAARDMATLPFSGFADTQQATLNPPAVAADGNLVFKARLARDPADTFGVFQSAGAGAAAVALAEPSPDDLRVLPADHGPYSLDRWVAGIGGAAYLMATPQGGKARLYKRAAGSAALQSLVVADLTPVNGTPTATLSQVSDFVLDGAGAAFVAGAMPTGPGVFRVDGEGVLARLTPVVLQGQPVPRPLDGTNVQGFVFNGGFSLVPDSARGPLLFMASVVKTGAPPRRGLFRFGPLGLETLQIECLDVGGARDISFCTLAISPARQTANGTTAFAIREDGRWKIKRWRAGVTTLVAQEGQTLPGGSGAKIVSLDPGPVLDLPPGSGPVFTLNDAGDVAFLATDGLKWGIYLFSDRF